MHTLDHTLSCFELGEIPAGNRKYIRLNLNQTMLQTYTNFKDLSFPRQQLVFTKSKDVSAKACLFFRWEEQSLGHFYFYLSPSNIIELPQKWGKPCRLKIEQRANQVTVNRQTQSTDVVYFSLQPAGSVRTGSCWPLRQRTRTRYHSCSTSSRTVEVCGERI